MKTANIPPKDVHNYLQQEPLGNYEAGYSYGGAFNAFNNTDFDDNLLMDELDIDEILECDDIE